MFKFKKEMEEMFMVDIHSLSSIIKSVTLSFSENKSWLIISATYVTCVLLLILAICGSLPK